jgi:multiple antibiotic resistance protein
MSVASAAVLLFLVMDPVGNVPLFLSSLKTVAPERQLGVVARELVIAYAVLVALLFGGRPLLGLLGITEPALGIAGGVVLFLIALRMVFPSHDGSLREDVADEPLVVPLAIPYVAGPSALATVLLLSSREPARWPEWLLALTMASVAGAVILLVGSRLQRRLGQRGLIAMERLMGMVLVAIAVQMLLTGIRVYVAGM